MTSGELVFLSSLGIPLGVFLLGLLSGRGRVHLRKPAAKWCLIVGVWSTALAVLAVTTTINFLPTKSALFVVFIGLPALPAGVLLYVFRDHRTRANDA